MSKYVFKLTSNKYESNPKCKFCKVLDEQFNKLSSIDDQYEIQKLEKLLVNGYNLVDVLESNHYIGKYKTLMNYKSYNDDIQNKALSVIGKQDVAYNTYNAMSPTLIFGRWCKECGSRKHDIYDTKLTSELSSYVNYDFETHTLSWTDIDYKFGHYFRVYKKSDITEFEVLKETNKLSLVDEELEDGRVYTYLIAFVNELDEIILTKEKSILIPSNDHAPKTIEFEYRIHKYLDEDFNKHEYMYAKYEHDDDNFGKVYFKLNHDHVPSISYWKEDLSFDDDDRFVFPDDRTYFLKPYIRSRVFKKDGIDDHLNYPDLYFWNRECKTEIVQYHNFYEDNIYDLTFTPGKRSMHIEFKIKLPTTIKEIKIYFKQDDKYIYDTLNDDTYKILTIKPVYGVEEYMVDIEKLASNSKWVFGVFPTYEHYDEDIRKEYQNISMIEPHYGGIKYYKNKEDFYDINLWHKHNDFYRYDLKEKKEVHSSGDRGVVWVSDNLKHHDVSVLLIHDTEMPECFTLSYDFKYIAKNNKDRLNMFYNFKLNHKVKDINFGWRHFEKTYFDQDYVIIRWEVMKHSTMPWTCAFLDNICIIPHKIRDTKTDNYTFTEELLIKQKYLYNKRIRHDGKHRYAPVRVYYMNVKMNPYEKGDFEDIDLNQEAGEN